MSKHGMHSIKEACKILNSHFGRGFSSTTLRKKMREDLEYGKHFTNVGGVNAKYPIYSVNVDAIIKFYGG